MLPCRNKNECDYGDSCTHALFHFKNQGCWDEYEFDPDSPCHLCKNVEDFLTIEEMEIE